MTGGTRTRRDITAPNVLPGFPNNGLCLAIDTDTDNFAHGLMPLRRGSQR